MTGVLDAESTNVREYGSGERVEPGIYLDIETGGIVLVYEPDELPEGTRLVRYRRRFRRIAAAPNRAR
ncbi:MAG TPA: hypothetical protein VFB38_02975 [Chthonomonadaceae bacterium]|nr:hypothetical protein [Chthonomonadaceae bacterium]